jgi:hypothetical protein
MHTLASQSKPAQSDERMKVAATTKIAASFGCHYDFGEAVKH